MVTPSPTRTPTCTPGACDPRTCPPDESLVCTQCGCDCACAPRYSPTPPPPTPTTTVQAPANCRCLENGGQPGAGSCICDVSGCYSRCIAVECPGTPDCALDCSSRCACSDNQQLGCPTDEDPGATPTPVTSPTPCSTPVCPGSVLPPLCVYGPCSCYCEATPAPTLSSTPTPPCVPTPLIPPYCAAQCEPCPTIRAGCYAEACRQCIENPVCAPGETCVPRNPASLGCCSCATPTPTASVSCVGDCNSDHHVSVNELITGVNIILGNAPEDACSALLCCDLCPSYVGCLVNAVNNALNGCTQPTATQTPLPTPVLDCSGVPDGQECVGPCGPCNPSVRGYCHAGHCMTECPPCVTATRPPTPTPTPPIARCRDFDDCQRSGGQCLAPGVFAGCGVTPAPVPTWNQCQEDTDCRSRSDTFICAPVDPRWCQFGLGCVAGCQTDQDCAVGEACNPTHHCVPRPCTSDADCPPLFACADLPEGQRGCHRRACVTDPDCRGGFCVTGSCYEKLGACATPPA